MPPLPTFFLFAAIIISLLRPSSCTSPDNDSPDLLPKAPEHMLKNFLASSEAEPGASFPSIHPLIFPPFPLKRAQVTKTGSSFSPKEDS
jgi:hypothetical protein